MHTLFKSVSRSGDDLGWESRKQPRTVVLTTILLSPNLLPIGLCEDRNAAVDLARKVVTNELRVQNEGQSHWMCRLEKVGTGWKQIQEILETNDGSLSQLLSIDGHPKLNPRL